MDRKAATGWRTTARCLSRVSCRPAARHDESDAKDRVMGAFVAATPKKKKKKSWSHLTVVDCRVDVANEPRSCGRNTRRFGLPAGTTARRSPRATQSYASCCIGPRPTIARPASRPDETTDGSNRERDLSCASGNFSARGSRVCNAAGGRSAALPDLLKPRARTVAALDDPTDRHARRMVSAIWSKFCWSASG